MMGPLSPSAISRTVVYLVLECGLVYLESGSEPTQDGIPLGAFATREAAVEFIQQRTEAEPFFIWRIVELEMRESDE